MRARYRHTQLVTVIGGGTVTVEHDYEHSAPMSHGARLDAYYRQNGYQPLTDRQHRQLKRMARKAFR